MLHTVGAISFFYLELCLIFFCFFLPKNISLLLLSFRRITTSPLSISLFKNFWTYTSKCVPWFQKTQYEGRCHCGQICLLLSGIILISFGLSIFIYVDQIYEYILNTSLKFSPDSPAYKAWSTNDPPLRMDLYLFNWTNPEDIYNRSVKPRFEEVGPYRCFEVKEKTNVTWHNNRTVSFLTRRLYYFDEKNSPRKLSDIISTINVVPLVCIRSFLL